MTGRVVDAATGEPAAEAEVDVFFWFTVDGPGNQGAPSVLTDAEGRFTARLQFTASCAPVLFGFFGSEAGNTAGPPRRLDVTVRVNDIETTREFDVRRDEEVNVDYEEIPGLGIEGNIRLPTLTAEPPS